MTINDELFFDLSQVLKICCNIPSKEKEDVLKWVSLSYNFCIIKMISVRTGNFGFLWKERNRSNLRRVGTKKLRWWEQLVCLMVNGTSKNIAVISAVEWRNAVSMSLWYTQWFQKEIRWWLCVERYLHTYSNAHLHLHVCYNCSKITELIENINHFCKWLKISNIVGTLSFFQSIVVVPSGNFPLSIRFDPQ